MRTRNVKLAYLTFTCISLLVYKAVLEELKLERQVKRNYYKKRVKMRARNIKLAFLTLAFRCSYTYKAVMED